MLKTFLLPTSLISFLSLPLPPPLLFPRCRNFDVNFVFKLLYLERFLGSREGHGYDIKS